MFIFRLVNLERFRLGQDLEQISAFEAGAGAGHALCMVHGLHSCCSNAGCIGRCFHHRCHSIEHRLQRGAHVARNCSRTEGIRWPHRLQLWQVVVVYLWHRNRCCGCLCCCLLSCIHGSTAGRHRRLQLPAALTVVNTNNTKVLGTSQRCGKRSSRTQQDLSLTCLLCSLLTVGAWVLAPSTASERHKESLVQRSATMLNFSSDSHACGVANSVLGSNSTVEHVSENSMQISSVWQHTKWYT